jgi:hypothetical protein
MTDQQQQIMQRLPYHTEQPPRAVYGLVREGKVLAVITEGEAGANLYPGPRR